jgi:hypothetical protein
MSTDLEKLLGDATSDPTTTIDTDELWAAGRRRRWVRRAGAAGGTAALVFAVAVAGVNLAGPGTPDIAPLGQSESTGDADGSGIVDDGDAQELARELERQRQEELRAEAEAEARAAEEEAARQAEAEAELEAQQQAAEEAGEAGEAGSSAPSPSPSPDPALVADPCAPHQEREQEAFITVAGPVAGQQVGSSFELVGCSNVYEATVRYRVVGSGGAVLVDDFTTAACGTGCVGEFREVVSLPAGSGSLTLEVFWESPKDGAEQDKVSVALARS